MDVMLGVETPLFRDKSCDFRKTYARVFALSI